MKSVYIDSKELKAKKNYSEILISMCGVVIFYCLIKYAEVDGIWKWVFYFFLVCSVCMVIYSLTTYQISYCKSCNNVFDYKVTKCPFCWNELAHMGKSAAEDEIRKNIKISDIDLLKGRQDVARLIEALQHANTEVRRGAVSALGEIGPEARAAVPALVQTLEENKGNLDDWLEEESKPHNEMDGKPHKETQIRFDIHRSSDELIKEFLQEKHCNAMSELSEEEMMRVFGRPKDEVIQQFLSGYVGSECYSMAMVLIARKLIRKHGELIAVRCLHGPQIKLLFKDTHKIVVTDHSGYTDITMIKFGYSGTGSECFHAFLNEAGFNISLEEIEKIKPPLTLKNFGVREKAAEALGNIGDERAIKPLAHALEDDDRDVREKAAEALEKIREGGTAKESHTFASQQINSPEEDCSETKTNFEEMRKNRHGCLTILVKDGIWSREFADRLEEQCENSERNILIMLSCETPEQITNGFCKIAKELQRKDDPLFETAEMGCSAQSSNDEDYIKMRDTFVNENWNFISVVNKRIREELQSEASPEIY